MLFFDGRTRHFPTALFSVFRRQNPTLSDSVIFYISTAKPDILRRLYLMYFDGGMRHGSTAENFTIRRHFTTFSDGKNRHITTALSAIFRRRKPTYYDGVIFCVPTAYFLLFQHKTRRRFVMRNAAAQIFRNSFPIKNKRRYVSVSPHKSEKFR